TVLRVRRHLPQRPHRPPANERVVVLQRLEDAVRRRFRVGTKALQRVQGRQPDAHFFLGRQILPQLWRHRPESFAPGTFRLLVLGPARPFLDRGTQQDGPRITEGFHRPTSRHAYRLLLVADLLGYRGQALAQ